MKKIYLVLAVLLASVGLSNAQRVCGTMEHHAMMIAQDPSFQNNLENIEEHTRQFIQNNGARVVVNIPVVFHVVYNTAAQNISDALLNAQLAQLNQDFRKLNSDNSLTPSLFAGVSADMEINFCLAQQTPTGAATTGINRVSTTKASFSTNDGVKSSTTGGSNAWDATKYLNLWVCNMSGGVLGYAQFPGGAAATDGVVLQYTSVGSRTSPSSSGAPYNLGRTSTHEVGHWLNLRHIWGDATCGSDLVSDTPTHTTSNFGCPAYPKTNTCTGGGTEMTMNYMDYTDDACMYMFSAGQKARAQALFATGGSRIGLLTSVGCNAPSGGTTCNVPTTLSSSSVSNTSATVSWAAATGALSYSLQYKTSTATTWTTVSATSTSASLTGLTASTIYNFQVASVCSAGTSAYSTAGSFTTTAASTACSDTREPNESRTAAKAITLATNIQGLISSATDKDYFSFSNLSTAKNIKVTLTNLPADYDLNLIKGTTTVATSANAGTTSESIIYNTTTTATTYYAYVFGYGGVFNTSSCYTLRVETSNVSWVRMAGEVEADDASVIEGPLSIYPNPSNGTLNIRLQPEADINQTVTVYNNLGQLVESYNLNFTKEQPAVEIRLNDLTDGIYFVRVYDGSTVQTRKVLLRK
jgi:hypothetical protein